MKLDIWEFVRLMVAVEDQADNSLMQAFGTQWQEVDQALAELSQSDHIAYSDLMLNQHIDLGTLNRDQKTAGAEALTRVIAELKTMEEDLEPDDAETIKLERKALAKRLKSFKS